MWLLLVSLFGLIGSAVGAKPAPPQAMETRRLSAIVRKFERQMGLDAPVIVSIVEKNERLASVRPSKTRPGAYLLELDQQFLATLTREEETAVIAHELGHVWIFTHHPYIQSEPLANEKAMALVSEASLERVYRKVWAVDGSQGNFSDYLDRSLNVAHHPAVEAGVANSEVSTLHQ